MTIGLITDTNFLTTSIEKRYKGKEYLDVLNYFINYIDSLIKMKCETRLIYYVPEIVLEELYYQKLDAFRLKYNSMKEKYCEINYAIKGDFPQENAEEIFKQEKEEYYKKVNVIKLDYNEIIFKEIVNDALNKYPPFDANNPNVGFKDTLIWKTILYSKEVDNCDVLFFFSGDKIFTKENNDKFLIEEFKKKHSNTDLRIHFFEPNGNQRQEALNKLIEEYKLPRTEFVKLYDKNLIIRYFDKIKFNDEDVEYYIGNGIQAQLTNIYFSDFDITDFSVINVDKENDNYYVKCAFRTRKYDTSVPTEDEIKHCVIGNIELILKENQQYVSSKVSGVEFDLGIINLLRGLEINEFSKIASKVSETIKDNFSTYQAAIKPLIDSQEELKKTLSQPFKEMQENIANLSKAISISTIPITRNSFFSNKKDDDTQ